MFVFVSVCVCKYKEEIEQYNIYINQCTLYNPKLTVKYIYKCA